jgi:predicted ABC-type transport system involved in lysophospholipase L1 biosynthesis ATPase subunit
MILICDLHKSFAAKKVLQGVDLTIASGETTTIIGGSGSGKSVLFKHIIGLMKPDAGSILVDGEDITKMGERDLYRMVEKFGLVFQSGALFDSQLFVALEIWDVLSGMIKSVFFGLTIAVIGSYFGLKTEGGAKGVGRATTTAVVVSSVIILVSDFFWTKILPFSLR